MKKKPTATRRKTDTKSKKSVGRKKRPVRILSKANFSKDKKYFVLQERIINLQNVYSLEIRYEEAPKAKDGEDQIVIEKPYRVIAIMPLNECPCWMFETVDEAKNFVAEIWSYIK